MEIYEGDIVKTRIRDKEYVGSIKYADIWAQFYFSTKNEHGVGIALDSVHGWYYEPEGDGTISEVIGNVYENPLLMEAQDDQEEKDQKETPAEEE